MWTLSLAALCFSIWAYLLLARGGFWRIRPEPPVTLTPPRRTIVAVIPARDESDTIAKTIQSLAAQTIPVTIIVADDHSTDGTGAIAQRAGAHVVSAAPLQPGWTGKLWAVSEGLKAAAGYAPDYLLLTDADIEHDPGNVRDLLARAERDQLDLTSLMVKLRCDSVAEKLLMPAFVYFFFKLYPPAWAANPADSTAAAAGGCMLVRWTALERIGGIQSIRGELIDDCSLARRIKESGDRLWLGVTDKTCSIRPYEGFAPIWRMISRSAYTQLNYSCLLLAGSVLGMLLTYVLPFVLLLITTWAQPAWWLAAATVIILVAMFQPVLRLYRQSWTWGVALPFIALFYTAATVDSAVRYWTGRGGEWKGRVQAQRSAATARTTSQPIPDRDR